jgi:hypothetical protein
MSAAVIKGKGCIWSIGTITFTGSVLAAPSTHDFLPQKFDFSRTSQKTEVKGLDGGTQLQVFSDFKRGISITVVPSGSTIAATRTSADAWLPKPGDTITITDTESAIVDAASNANKYNVLSSKQGRTVDGVATADLEIEQSDDGYDLTTTIS